LLNYMVHYCENTAHYAQFENNSPLIDIRQGSANI
jgi:hypothetical protein